MKITLLAVLFGVIFFAVAIYNNQKNKKRLLNQLSRQFGEKPEGDNDKFDMEFLKKYYNVRSENEESRDCIDEITWNDLDMDSVFKRINYTETTLGEAYLYYKLRNEKYDKDDWEKIEKLIKIFMENEELRNNVKFKMMKVGKFNNSRLINFIYNPSFIAIKGYFKYPLLAVCLLASIVLSFVNVKIGMPLTILFLVSNALLYNCEKLSLENNYDVMTYLIKNLDMYARLSDIKDSSFNEYRIRIKDTLKNVKEINKIRMYSYAFSKGGNNLVNDLDFLADYLKMFTMTDVITYQRISKILEKNKQYLYDIYDFIAKIDF
ncbi:MAG: DNA mismatch repair protein MutS, partial [Inconstantimicrobium porci]|nr:DNA mismatch repair protein MutS [Inconstantimicrobium porci]